jgi:hypothetical protein
VTWQKHKIQMTETLPPAGTSIGDIQTALFLLPSPPLAILDEAGTMGLAVAAMLDGAGEVEQEFGSRGDPGASETG